jgi:hypothetical protein
MLWPLWQGMNAPLGASVAEQGLPWQVQAEADGSSRVFGLNLGHDDLSAAEALWGRDLVLALIAVSAESGAPPALEAYVESFQAGFVSGKLVLALGADPAWLAAAWERAPRGDVNAAGTAEAGVQRRRELAPDDWTTARHFPVIALSLLPSARLDEAAIVQRFGAPHERWPGAQGSLQLLYPSIGVAVALPPSTGESARARSVIQYVAPRDAERLLFAPLRRAAAP